MKCPRCEKPVGEDSKFCPECGERLSLSAPHGLAEGWHDGCLIYSMETLDRFRRLLESEDWLLPKRPWNDSGTLQAEHEPTGLRFVLIPEGRFEMGSEDGWKDERPVHPVTVRSFLMAEVPCSQRAWDRVGGGTDEREARGEDLPIERVSWEHAYEWCESVGLRLPSEAEWEYAARAETTTPWFFGEDYGQLGDYAWCLENSDRRTHRVGRKKPNPWGLHDVYGNVFEWCEDHWHETYENAPTDSSAWSETDEQWVQRVLRGGSCHHDEYRCRSACRERNVHRRRWSTIGFRPVNRSFTGISRSSPRKS